MKKDLDFYNYCSVKCPKRPKVRRIFTIGKIALTVATTAITACVLLLVWYYPLVLLGIPVGFLMLFGCVTKG